MIQFYHKNSEKNYIALALAFCLALGMIGELVYADITNETENENEGYHKVHNSVFGVDVSVKDGVEVSEETITGILAGVSKEDRGSVSIVSVEKLVPKTDKGSLDSNLIMPTGSSFYYTKHISNNAYVTNKKFLISVAKGMVSTLSSSVTLSADVKISGSFEASFLDFVKGKIESDFGSGLSRTISTSHQFSELPENSKHNSRSYYAGIVNDMGHYKV